MKRKPFNAGQFPYAFGMKSCLFLLLFCRFHGENEGFLHPERLSYTASYTLSFTRNHQ